MGKYDNYKQDVFTSTQWLSENGFFGTVLSTGGNVSVKIEDRDIIVITPSSKPYNDLTPEDMCVVDFEMNLIEGSLQPSIETAMHLEVFKNRQNINSVIHTHQIFASILAVLNHPIPAIFDEIALSIGEIVDVIPYAMSGTPELVNNVSKKLANQCHCYILQNHGALTIGSNIKKAMKNAELLEKAAKVYYYVLSTGKEFTTLPESTINLFKELRESGIN